MSDTSLLFKGNAKTLSCRQLLCWENIRHRGNKGSDLLSVTHFVSGTFALSQSTEMSSSFITYALQEMVDKTLKKAKGFAAQIYVMLKSDPVITMGEAVPFPSLKILSIKTVNTYVVMNETIDARGKSDEPGMAAITKKKRTTKSKASPSKASMDMVSVAQDAVPLQIIKPILVATAEQPPVPKRKSKKRKLRLPKGSDDENVEERVAVENVENVEKPITVDWFDRSYEDFVSRDAEQLIMSTNDLDKGTGTSETVAGEQQVPMFVEKGTVAESEGSKDVVVAKVFEKSIGSNQIDEDLMTLDDLLMQISDDMMLPSVTAGEITKIKSDLPLKFKEVHDQDWYYASLTKISATEKGKAPLREADTVKGNPSREMVQLICADVDFLVQMRQQIDEDLMTLDDLLMQISDDMMLPSVTAGEITKIKSDLPLKFKEVHDQDWYYASLTKISATEKGKAPLEEADTVKGNPSREMVQLICADVDFLVQMRQQVMQDFVELFHSFSINNISDLESLRELAEKEKHMLLWVETDSLETAVKRRVYILAKYREMLLRKFLDSHRKYFTPAGQLWTVRPEKLIEINFLD
ncbi:hypothetical protein F511_33778 [Dorcoceras hygrometricum]|uniref:Splicing factor 3B subunit 1-like n=1 Tax=Dorcoceras hygrometricum TaxID=472368 RepID=A0A2Z7CWM4_9LAMI|nr:hypothetical protein F511_33778 [Dorcoceras hygrometricum]